MNPSTDESRGWPMNVGIIGSGRIGSNAARLFARADHDVLISFSRDPAKLAGVAKAAGSTVQSGSPAEAVRFANVVMLSVPWTLIDLALAQAGSLDGKIVIDTTNQFGAAGLEPLPHGLTAAQVNGMRMPGARLVKAFNTLTARFQAEASTRSGNERAVMFYCGDDREAKATVAKLIEDCGFAAVDMGGLAEAVPMEAPRRPGAVYGEEYRLPDALKYVEARRRHEPPPPLPDYSRK
jgi:predicted dinucleotide-binding enzyme